eukprot:SAG22_NODE_6915_length_795_cov_1.527299_1_plen_237_part_10
MECIADLRHKPTGSAQRVVLGASCKTERCFVPDGVWMGAEDGLSADFAPIGSQSKTAAEQWLVLKTYDTVGKSVPVSAGPNKGQPQPDRQLETVASALDSLRLDVRQAAGTSLPDAGSVIAAGLANEVLVCRSSWETASWHVSLTYPCKTINLNERQMVYQPDTGPVLYFPDIDTLGPDEVIGAAQLAYVAWNGNHPGWAEFLVQAPATVAPGVETQHYSLPVRVDAVANSIVQLG